MEGTLITTSRDTATGLDYSIYLIKYENKLWIATYDVDHGMLVQVQGVNLLKEKVPECVQSALHEWLL